MPSDLSYAHRKESAMKKSLLILFAATVFLCACSTEKFDNISLKSTSEERKVFSDASVHDPSVIDYDGTYYIFGSHLAAAKSDDLMNWKMIASGVKKSNILMPDALNAMPETFVWAKTSTLWAPDVIQLEDGRFYMYYCACEGSSPLSAMGIAVSETIEGPYQDLGIFLRSGMTDIPSENGDYYDATVYPNVVDPDVFFDAGGRLWMMYGSYSGGIYILELDTKTGFPLETGYGKKILGGNHLRIEAPYVLYHPQSEYYYLFMSFGGLAADGGYNIRVARSKSPDGPYYDAAGNDMIDCKGADGSFFDDTAAQPYGTKLLGNYKWLWTEGEEGQNRRGILSPGHNSALYQKDTGNMFIIFHTRFEYRKESHEVRVHPMFLNNEDWPVIAPYRYTGEHLSIYEDKDIAGPYKFINHGSDISADIKSSDNIILYSNGKIGGDHKGSWRQTEDAGAELTVDSVHYNGVFLKQYDEFGQKYVMSFTALSENGIAIWGSGLAAMEQDASEPD